MCYILNFWLLSWKTVMSSRCNIKKINQYQAPGHVSRLLLCSETSKTGDWCQSRRATWWWHPWLRRSGLCDQFTGTCLSSSLFTGIMNWWLWTCFLRISISISVHVYMNYIDSFHQHHLMSQKYFVSKLAKHVDNNNNDENVLLFCAFSLH